MCSMHGRLQLISAHGNGVLLRLDIDLSKLAQRIVSTFLERLEHVETQAVPSRPRRYTATWFFIPFAFNVCPSA